MTTAQRLAAVVFVVFVLLGALPQPVHAARTIKVGNGTAASCTEDALRNALVLAGGERSSIVQFKCGAEPVTIVVGATLTVPDNTTINGDGLITLDGQAIFGQTGNGPILRVDRESIVTIKNLNIVRGGPGHSGDFSGGGIYNAGTLEVNHSTFSGSATAFGGAVFNQGTLTVHDSTFANNIALNIGGGIFSQGTLSVHGSTFTGNSSAFGAAIFAEGTLTVHDSVFDGHNQRRQNLGLRLPAAPSTSLDTPSGAITLGLGTHEITHSTITRNRAPEVGGGINLLAGTLTVSDSIISENTAFLGGGIYVSRLSSVAATLTIRNSTIFGNVAVDGGGIAAAGTISIKDSTIAQNSGGRGGGILNYEGGTFAIKNSVITQNTASFLGGGIYNAGVLTVKDSSITENVAASDGGGIYSFGTPPKLINTFVINNTPNDIAP
jgi:predicted outer membrane repeat protein